MISKRRAGIVLAAFLAAMILLLALPAMRVTASTNDGVAEFLVFNNPNCQDCKFLPDQLLPQLKAQYGNKIKYDYLSVDNFNNFRDMINLEQSYGRTEMATPQVYIGKTALIGPDEIKQNLQKTIQLYLDNGGSDMPVIPQSSGITPSVTEKPVYPAFPISNRKEPRLGLLKSASDSRNMTILRFKEMKPVG
jgi:glutaredoxin